MPTPDIYAKMSTDDLLALKQGAYDRISTEGLQLLRGGPGGAAFGSDADAGKIGTPESPRPYKGEPDQPLEQPLIDPIDLIPGGIAAKGGATAGSALANGPLRGLLRYRLGTNPGQGFEKVAETVAETAPKSLRPAEASAEGLSDVMRGTAGKAGLKASREEGIGGLYRELLAAEKAATSDVPGKADRFKQLVTELADANRAGYNPVTAEARTGSLSLKPLREGAAIRGDIQSILTPDQWAKFQALQDEYAKGSGLLRLFKAPTSGARRGAGTDVLTDQAALQSRAKGMQGQLDPELLKTIFRGGAPLETDKSATIPLGLARFGSIRLPGTVMAGPPSTVQDLLLQLLSGGATLGAGVGGARGLQP